MGPRFRARLRPKAGSIGAIRHFMAGVAVFIGQDEEQPSEEIEPIEDF